MPADWPGDRVSNGLSSPPRPPIETSLPRAEHFAGDARPAGDWYNRIELSIQEQLLSAMRRQFGGQEEKRST
jgi:hypothetical protein